MQTYADNLSLVSPGPQDARLVRHASDLADRLLRMTQSLQTTLEISALLELFYLQTDANVPVDGMDYVNEQLSLDYRTGTRSRHTCHYNLKVGDIDLGGLTFRRRGKFSEAETVVLEKLLCCLLYPLRNALLYRDALALAQKDALTGICNRAALDDALATEVNLAGRHRTPLSIVVFDIDHFKSINDRYGHSMGDEAIKTVVKCAQSCARSTDMLFRYGGEEFVMLVRNTTLDGARLLAERIRRKVEKLQCQGKRKPITMTVSAGVATLGSGEKAQQLFERADKALFEAKHAGRNLVCVSDN
jgi:diguanylate cyclase (GGDEF)-like protein